jgi:hypothetical protein
MSSQAYLFNPTERTLAANGDGFAPPRFTTTGRLALSLTPADRGMIVYDTTLTHPLLVDRDHMGDLLPVELDLYRRHLARRHFTCRQSGSIT